LAHPLPLLLVLARLPRRQPELEWLPLDPLVLRRLVALLPLLA
jgi:hypothetical protein